MKGQLLKINEKLGIVIGYAVVSKTRNENGKFVDHYDAQGDCIPDEVLVKAAADFMAGDRPVLEMHSGGPKGRVLFCLPIDKDICKALEIDSPRYGLVIGMKVEPDVLAKFASGHYEGFSISGDLIDYLEMDEEDHDEAA